MLKKIKTIVWYVTYGKWSSNKPWWLTLNDLLDVSCTWVITTKRDENDIERINND